MASVQGNPGFVKGQIPTAAQWNAAWTVKQDALISTQTYTGPGTFTVPNTLCKAVCDTSAGVVTLIVPLAYGSPSKENRVRVVKKSATPNTNIVSISNGSVEVAEVINENDSGGSGCLEVDSDGTRYTFFGTP